MPAIVLKPHGSIFFGSVESMLDTYSRAYKHQTLIIDMGEVTMVDLTGIYAFEDLIASLQKKNIDVFMTNIDSKIEDAFEKTGSLKTIGKDHITNDLHSIFNAIDSQKA